jgi:energy-coupling factor transporter ATP-binding protein EcfA2
MSSPIKVSITQEPQGKLNDTKLIVKSNENNKLVDCVTTDLQADKVVTVSDKEYRAHIHSSLDGENIDIFVRQLYDECEDLPKQSVFPFRAPMADKYCGYFPNPEQDLKYDDGKSYLLTASYLADLCFEGIEDYIDRGMIVVCGETGCGKSQFVQKLAFKILEKKYTQAFPNGETEKTLHYITYEDPVETPFYFKMVDGKPVPDYTVNDPNNVKIQVTHREKGENCKDLESFFNSALRQKPALTFIGETRDKEDWQKHLDFALTGHLAMTTCHAGSIRECLSKILLATKAENNPAKRSYAANALVCIIHLQVFHLKKRGKKKNLVLPSLFVFDKQGTAKIIADNLDAVQPGNEKPSIGYYHNFVEAKNACVGSTWVNSMEKIASEVIDMDLERRR